MSIKQKVSYSIDKNEISGIRSSLLCWYAEKQRDLPWRRAAANPDKQQHAYAVWVSEIMLQQTRVSTVIDYYNRWMTRWPTVVDLAGTTLDQVNEVWAGLGYYSRGRRLHEGAIKVVKQLDGKIPETAAGLAKHIPGVGRYTAAAISSIAFDEAAGVLDGNVIRVLCRLLTIGGDCSSKNVLAHLWKQVDLLVTQETPGDFNQAMMELGALVCTPKSPDCSECPLRQFCRARKKAEDYKNENSVFNSGTQRKRKTEAAGIKSWKIRRKDPDLILGDHDVEIESCADFLSLPEHFWIPDLGVTNYPRKAKKKPPRQETAFVSVVEMKDVRTGPQTSKYLVTQRPKTGLLAGLWEFPTLLLTENLIPKKINSGTDKASCLSSSTTKVISEKMDPVLQKHLAGVNIAGRTTVGEYTHMFSHIHLRYIIEHILVVPNGTSKHEYKEEKLDGISPCKWVSENDLSSCAMSSAMHKILKICHKGKGKSLAGMKAGKVDKSQPKLDAFFTSKAKNVRLHSVKSEIDG